MSQLDLALAAGVSSRHVAFLETERSKPSRAMVLNLTSALEVPAADRNQLLLEAGFAPAYVARPLDEQDMAHVLGAIDWMLTRHAPYPAFAVDRHWNVAMANATARTILAAIGVTPGESLLQALQDARLLRQTVCNWPEVACHLSERLRRESSRLGGDAVLDEAVIGLREEAADFNRGAEHTLAPIMPLRLRLDDQELALFSVISEFTSAQDAGLAELKIELMFPADDASRGLLEALADGA